MRLIYTFGIGLVVTACASVEEEPPATIDGVNPVMEQRIEQRVLEGRAGPVPDVSDVPGQAPEMPAKAAVKADKSKVLAEWESLNAQLDKDLTAEEEAVLEARAAELMALIARDRERAEAEGALSDDDDIYSAPTTPVDPAGEK